MATTPRIDDTGALALKPARVNIFAEPEGAERELSSSGARTAGVFDAAACAGVAAPVAGSWSEDRRRHGTRVPARWGALRVLLIAVAALVAALAVQPRDEVAPDRATPRLQRPSKPPPPARPNRQRPAAHGATTRRPSRKRAKPHRPSRPRRTSRDGTPTPHEAPVPIAPAAPERPAPSSAAPAGPRPAPVPPDSPPEFM